MIDFYFVTPNSFLTLPPVNQFYQHFKKNFNIIVMQSQILNYHDFFETEENYVKIIEYSNYNAYHKQTTKQKFYKIIKFITIYLKRFAYSENRNKKKVIYVSELFPLFLAILFKKKNEYIIYHQFEVLNEKLNLLDKLSLWWIKNKNNKLDLAIFPEKNRSNLFTSELKRKDLTKTLIVPNSNNNKFNEKSLKFNKNKIIVTHIGAVGKNHHIKNFINAVSKLDEEKYEFRFVGRLGKDVEELIKEYNLKSVKVLGQVKHNELKKYYLETDIGVVLYRDIGLNFKFCAPNKLYEYWSYGIPVLGDNLPGLQSVFTHNSLGKLVDMSNLNEIKDGLTFLSKKEKSLEIRKYFEKKYMLQNYLLELDKTIQTMLK